MTSKFRKSVRIPFILALILASGCVSARMSDHVSNRLFREGRYEEAAKKLEESLEKKGLDHVDSLLYILDIGLSYHAARMYAESNKWFLKAEDIAEIKDYTSLATEGVTLFTSENIKSYKGENFEKVLINTYLAMNYALMGKFEDALVEARKVNRKLYLMITKGEKPYQLNAFARYLAGVLYEARREYSDAYIDYKKMKELQHEWTPLGEDLFRMAYATRSPGEARRWAQEYGLSEEQKKTALDLIRGPPRLGEVVILFENGISPIKRSNPQFRTLPKFYPRRNPVSHAWVSVDGKEMARTRILHDIEATAIKNLDDQYAGMVAKKIGGVVAKEVVAHQIDKQDKTLGFLARVLFYASDQADVRSWNLLPKDLQIARVPLAPGDYEITLETTGVKRTLPAQKVTVRAGRKVFVDFRYAPYSY